jgi:hypothetical protein
MEDGYRIWIETGADHFGTDLRIGLVRGGQAFIAKPIELEFEPLERGLRIPPTMAFEDRDGMAFLDALKIALMNHHGIREGHVEGELKATKEHLKDLHDLLWDHLEIGKAKEKVEL